MKKFFMAFICAAVILSSSTSLAAVDGSKIAIGSISPGINANDLINAFGQPTYKDGDDWTYAKFKVEVKRGVVNEISTCSEAIVTPGGVRVGQAAEILNSTFGKADKVDRDYNEVEYKYYSADRSKKIEFKVVNGIIAKITCELND